jgi:hypothetical protein
MIGGFDLQRQVIEPEAIVEHRPQVVQHLV